MTLSEISVLMIKSLKIIYLYLFVFLFLFLFTECYGLFANLFLSLSVMVVVLFSDFVLRLLFCIWVVVLFGRLCQSCLFGNCNERKKTTGKQCKNPLRTSLPSKMKMFREKYPEICLQFCLWKFFFSLFLVYICYIYTYVCQMRYITLIHASLLEY